MSTFKVFKVIEAISYHLGHLTKILSLILDQKFGFDTVCFLSVGRGLVVRSFRSLVRKYQDASSFVLPVRLLLQ